DALGSGQDITVTTGTIHSLTGSVALNAGDNVVAQSAATLQALTTITITGDAGNADSGTGATVTVKATLTAASAIVNGNTDNDPVHLPPSGGTPITVHGSAPALPTLPGDTLDLDLSSVASPTLTITAPGNGTLTSGNRANLDYTSIETLNTSNGTL